MPNRFPFANQRIAKLQNIASLAHDHSDSNCRFAIESHQKTRRGFVASSDLGDVPQTKYAAGSFYRYGLNLLNSTEIPVDSDMDSILQGVDRSGSEHHTLPSNTIEDLLRCDPQGGQLAMRELQKDLLLLVSDNVHLLDVVDLQESLASLLAHPLELGQRIIVSCKRVNRAVDVPVLVVDARSDQARW